MIRKGSGFESTQDAEKQKAGVVGLQEIHGENAI